MTGLTNTTQSDRTLPTHRQRFQKLKNTPPAEKTKFYGNPQTAHLALPLPQANPSAKLKEPFLANALFRIIRGNL